MTTSAIGSICGTKLFSDDLASFVRDEYTVLLGLGAAAKDIETLISKYINENVDPLYASVAWLALAVTEHKFGTLSEAIKNRALQAIDSGEDLKKWENAVNYEPYGKYEIELTGYYRNVKKTLDEIAGNTQKEAVEAKNIVEQKFKEQSSAMLGRLIDLLPAIEKAFPDKKMAKPPKFVKKTCDADIFFDNINTLDGNCKQKLERRKKELDLIRNLITSEQLNSKIKRIIPVTCPWKEGDSVAIKIWNAGRFNFDYEIPEGNYIIIKIINVVRDNLSKLVPELGSNESAVIGLYDYCDKRIPSPEELKSMPYIFTAIFKDKIMQSTHTGLRLYFSDTKNILKKTEWKVIANEANFLESLPDFFKQGVMNAIINSFDDHFFSSTLRMIKTYGKSMTK